MKALWQIILQILWRLRPVQALEVNLSDVIAMGLAMFSDDHEVDHIAQDPAYRSKLAAAFFDGHRKLDLLIYLRACEIAGVRPRITSFKPDYSHTHNSADLMKLWKSFHRLVAKFDDYERYAQKRAERLRAEDNAYPLRLAATLQFTSPALCAVEANSPLQLNARFASTSASHWRRWIARTCAQDGGGGAFARGWLNATGPPSSHAIAHRHPPRSHLRERPHMRQSETTRPAYTPTRRGDWKMRLGSAFVASIALAACATVQPAPATSLAGKWTVDLSTNPAEPYTKAMQLTLAPDGSVTGSFYDSEIQAGRWKTDRGRTCVSFRTTDGAGPYHSAACLVGSGVQGQTWAEHRNFLFNWNAVRAE